MMLVKLLARMSLYNEDFVSTEIDLDKTFYFINFKSIHGTQLVKLGLKNLIA